MPFAPSHRNGWDWTREPTQSPRISRVARFAVICDHVCMIDVGLSLILIALALVGCGSTAVLNDAATGCPASYTGIDGTACSYEGTAMCSYPAGPSPSCDGYWSATCETGHWAVRHQYLGVPCQSDSGLQDTEADEAARDVPGPAPTCGYPPDAVFSRSCIVAADCSFGLVQVVPCHRAAVGYRSDDAANFSAYRDQCLAVASNYPGRDAGVCATEYEDLLTDDGLRTYMGSLARVSVECRSGVCATVYQ